MTLPAWVPVLLAIPVLLLGEWICRRILVFRRFNIPEPVVGGLLISFVILLGNVTGLTDFRFDTTVTDAWWTWLVRIEPDWLQWPKIPVTEPLMVAFFTCIGLNATWDLVRRGGMDVVRFLALATIFAVLQNGLGVLLAQALGQHPLLGLVCGSITLTGGHGTAIGFAPLMAELGLPGAAVLGTAAATVGVVAGGLIGGPVGTRLMERHHLHARADAPKPKSGEAASHPGILDEFRALMSLAGETTRHLLLILICVKAGAWVSYLLQGTGIKFPPQMGAMIVGVTVRNALDLTGHRWIRYDAIDLFGAVTLAIFLTVTMMSLNLLDLANAATPMLIIIAAQIAVMALFAFFITYRVMGRDYDAAVMAGGHCGFGLGATSNAMATMKVLVARHGAAPRAFLVIPVVGAILIDFTNALNITVFANLLK